MGKIRKTRHHKAKYSASSQRVEEEEPIIDSNENIIQTIMDQLQGADVEEKYCGLQTFAMLIESSDKIEQVIKKDVIKVVAPLLIDSASSVRNAAAGALRNFSTSGIASCEALMDQDVMTPLICYFHECADSWNPEDSSKSKEEDIDTFIQNTNLLWNLCESSELAVKYLGQSRILDILPRYLDLTTFGTDIVIAVLQCLFVVLEDNPAAMEKIKSNSETQLQNLLILEDNDSSVHLLRTLAAGVVIHSCNGFMSSLPVNVINQIFTILAATLCEDHRIVCNKLSSDVPLEQTNSTTKIDLKGKAAMELEKNLKAVLQLIEAQQSAIEIIANMCSGDDAEESIHDGDSSENEDDGEELCTNGEMSDIVDDKLTAAILEPLVSLQIFEKVWTKTLLPAENVLLILKEYNGSQLIYKKLFTLQTHALLCINNMISSLPIENLGGVPNMYKTWVDAGKLLFKQDAYYVQVVESATAVMRAALDKIKLAPGAATAILNLFNELALSDIEIMLLGITSEVPEIRSNMIRMIGILALLLLNNLNETTSAVICTITDSILEQTRKESEVWVLAEAVDTLIDLYSEDETDGLAAKVKLIDKLSIIAPVFKIKAKQQSKLPKEYKVLVSTATSNLPRFIKYKKDRISKLQS